MTVKRKNKIFVLYEHHVLECADVIIPNQDVHAVCGDTYIEITPDKLGRGICVRVSGLSGATMSLLPRARNEVLIIPHYFNGISNQ